MPGFKILIIDDEPEVCTLIGNYFKAKKQEIQTANTLREGFQKYISFQPDILILDHNLPDGYGTDQIEEFRKTNPNTKIVVISAMSNLRERALENGAYMFLEKPISFSVLKKLIEN